MMISLSPPLFPGAQALYDATCARAGVFDLSGNLKEWTSDTRDRLRVVRGGSYETNVAAGLACAQENDLKDPTLRHPGIGFRCCR